MHASKFYRHICKEKNFLYLNGNNVLQPKVLEIIKEVLKNEEITYQTTKAYFSTFIPTFYRKFTARLENVVSI